MRFASFGFALLLTATSAPFQCSKTLPPERAMEEEPSEALYKLAEAFEAQGDDKARVTTLRTIVARYPSSRWAGMARQDLDALGATKPAPGR